MSNKIANERVALKLEFYLNGKKKVPSVSFIGVGDHGVPMTALNDQKQAAVFAEFSKAAHKFCKQMADAGELG